MAYEGFRGGAGWKKGTEKNGTKLRIKPLPENGLRRVQSRTF